MYRIRTWVGIAAISATAIGLGGCSDDVKRSLGLQKQAPDAFAVVSRAPLDLPPDYGLRPPQPGAGRPNEATPREQARFNLLGGNSPTANRLNATRTDQPNYSPGERLILKQAKADDVDPSIRDAVDRESLKLAKENDDFIESLVFWRSKDPPGTVVNAEEEAKRLRENAALGKQPTDGETPIIQRKQRGILEGLF